MTGRQADPELWTDRLAGAQAGGVGWLDAVGWPEDDGRWQVRLFTRAGTAAEAVAQVTGAGFRPDEVRQVSGAQMVAGTAEGPDLSLTLPGGAAQITCAPARTDLLAGRDCLLAFRNGESAAVVADWLDYHIRHHGLTGAVIIDRARPEAQDSFAAALADRLKTDARLAGSGLRLVLVASDQPLGRPDQGPETHAYLCPDAPGKDRMEAPATDPWASAPGEPLIYEAMKWRYLARAGAVVTIDCCDLLAPRPAGAVGVFDLCGQAGGGVVLLAGRRIYPWRVRPGQDSRFGDHFRRTFDARRGIARWGVQPEKAGLARSWRLARIAYAQPDPGGIAGFYRAMGIRAPGWKPAQLAPKSALIADPDLIALAKAAFDTDHSAALVPKAAPPLPPRPAPGSERTLIVTTMKNEGPFILEWLAYHRAIGVTDFLIYTNDCTDGTDRLLDLLQERGLVQHRDNPYRATPGVKPQHAALEAAEAEPVLSDADWAICMDVDEFITIRIGDGTLGALYQAMGGANMISLTWRLFGNADVADFQDRFVTEQFTLAAPELVRKPHQAWGFKTLFRTLDLYRKLGVHRPKGLKPELWSQVKWLNGSGQAMPQRLFRNGWRSSLDSYGYDWVQLNHYACRSAESFLVKRDRGRVNHVDRDQGVNYWFRMNHNAVEDQSISTALPLARAEWARLMADPGIAAAHGACVAAHRQRIADLMARADYRALYDALTGDRLRRLSRLLRHFGAAVFHEGPGVIPAELPLDDLPANFFFTVKAGDDAQH